jgi:hypothetical protein
MDEREPVNDRINNLTGLILDAAWPHKRIGLDRHADGTATVYAVSPYGERVRLSILDADDTRAFREAHRDRLVVPSAA